ncbi:hypothetical protein [Roseimarinus sediminis]|jgi:hypothetical protein|uniref:hypothetical protein n=1 Tax=Roseimarinus sediminis TaxID=1610899 RepID=UPI003D233798
MFKPGNIYNKYKNGIIFTLVFHIVVFILLNISQFKIKQEFVEAEILIDLPEIADPEILQQESERTPEQGPSLLKTNVASNRAIENPDQSVDQEYLKELEAARNLVKEVSEQLSRDIPTIDDLQMPEETSEGMDPDSILKKLYTGDSNVEYFLDNRYHTVLPIPVYLTQHAGTVTVDIEVAASGKVIRAEPRLNDQVNRLMLSYAKTAALRTRFNSVGANSVQSGYIRYHFIAQ